MKHWLQLGQIYFRGSKLTVILVVYKLPPTFALFATQRLAKRFAGSTVHLTFAQVNAGKEATFDINQ